MKLEFMNVYQDLSSLYQVYHCLGGAPTTYDPFFGGITPNILDSPIVGQCSAVKCSAAWVEGETCQEKIFATFHQAKIHQFGEAMTNYIL